MRAAKICKEFCSLYTCSDLPADHTPRWHCVQLDQNCLDFSTQGNWYAPQLLLTHANTSLVP